MTKLWTKRLMRLLASALIIALVTVVAYFAHAKSFAAGFLYLFPIMLIAFGWGLIDASIASVLAVGCLDYFFTEPLFHFYMADPQDWVALIGFEAVVLLVSQFADLLKRHAFESAQQREQAEKLYLMSRDVLLLDRSDTIGSQLVHLIVNVFELSSASLWDAREARVDSAGPTCIPEDEVRRTFLHRGHFDDEASKRFLRALLVGSRAIGAIGILGGSSNKPRQWLRHRCSHSCSSSRMASHTVPASDAHHAPVPAEHGRENESLRRPPCRSGPHEGST